MIKDYSPIDRKPSRSPKKIISIATLLIILALSSYQLWNFSVKNTSNSVTPQTFKCQTYEKVNGAETDKVKSLLTDPQFQNDTLTKLANAVRIPTEVYDTFPDPADNSSDPHWSEFSKLHTQLAQDFPSVWSKLSVETVNTFGLVLTWKGSDDSLKPLLLAAHMDVVPVERKTWNQWSHEPFGGEITNDPEHGTVIWGRGSFDDKNMLIGILQTLEYIITQESDFVPKRSIIVAVGFDEEASGYFGAKYISKLLYERYGQDGIYAIIDEGVNGIKEVENVLVASPGTGEKGRLNLWIELNTPGGHSSVPPDHTSIGIAAELITNIEKEKFPALFTSGNPVSQYYQCIAENSETMPSDLKWDFLHAMDDADANDRVIKYLIETGGKKTEYLLRTTQAIDIIHGGIKANALPETVAFLTDSRISIESSIDETLQKFLNKTLDISKKYDLGFIFEDEVLLPPTANGKFNVTKFSSLAPAPVSPNNGVWKTFAGTIKGFYEDVVFPMKFGTERELVVAPSIMTANTDTAHYWNLTRNIYRYQPGFAMADTLSTIHSVNEHVDLETLMHVVAFNYEYIHVVDNLDNDGEFIV